jgi:hypothetical protein
LKRRSLWRRVSSRRTLVVVSSVLGVFVVVGILACAGLGFLGLRAFSGDMADAQASANQFFDKIRTGQIEAAYRSTTQDFQADQSFDGFREFVKKNPALKTYTSRKTVSVLSRRAGRKVRPDFTATVRTTVSAPGNSTSFTVLMKKENRRWKVEKIYGPRW